jgi:hypothetical protein
LAGGSIRLKISGKLLWNTRASFNFSFFSENYLSKISIENAMHSEKLLSWLKMRRLMPAVRNNSKHFRRVLEKSLKARKEKILLIGDYGSTLKRVSPVITAAYYLAAQKMGMDAEVIMQGTKGRQDRADSEVIRRLKTLNRGSAVIMNVSNRLGTLRELGKSFRRYSKSREYRFLSTSGLGGLRTSEIFNITNAFNIDYGKLKKHAARLKEKMDGAREARLTTAAGTDVKFNIHGQKSIAIDGDYTKSRSGGNMPPGEVYIAPRGNMVEGRVVIDGSSRLKKTTMKLRKPITLEIRHGSVYQIRGGLEAMMLQRTLRWAKARSKFPMNVMKIGELGIGLNPNAKIVGSMVIDEKSLGTAHVALGSNYWFGGSIYSLIHLDQVFKNPKVFLDGKQIELPKKKDFI